MHSTASSWIFSAFFLLNPRDLSYLLAYACHRMPVMDGRQSATAIRKYEQTFDTPEHSSSSNRRVNHRIPIIAVSASLQQEQRVELAVNFDGWMLKPIDFKRMLHILGGLSDPARRQGSGFVPGQWERGGWFNVE